ncbi:hypothetical protein APHAL10511_001910 [Amanita phalloides]|nr:hypothetical protein APHAL10511_001910 [Amanita phalloides]
MAEAKIPLPKFLKILTDNNVPISMAMSVAGNIYKNYNTTSQLQGLTELQLTAAGVSEKEVRQLVISALRKAGYIPSSAPRKRRNESENHDSVAGPSTAQTASMKRRRKHKDADEMFAEPPSDKAKRHESPQFREMLDEEILKMKSIVINRAPVMMAWATVVAERLGFQREEALSIAAAYTEMNAISKGVSIGIYEKGKEQDLDADRNGSQPYVDIMGRRVPLFKMQSEQWHAILNATPASPTEAFSYISRSFNQTMPHVIGAMRLLAESYTPEDLNNKAWDFYTQFRPPAEGWGKRAKMTCATILNLRNQNLKPSVQQSALAEQG